MSDVESEKRLPEREGVIFLLFKNGNVLLEDRRHPLKPYYGYCIIPGGKVEKEKDQSIEETAEREIFEECGVRVRRMIYLDTFLHVTISNLLYHTTAYLVTEYEGEVVNNEGKAEHLWVDLDKALENLPFADSRYCIKLAKDALIEEGLLTG